MACAVVDGRTIVAGGSRDGTVRTWDLVTGEHVGPEFTFPEGVGAIGAYAGQLVIAFGSDIAVLKPTRATAP